MPIILDGKNLSLSQAKSVIYDRTEVTFSEEALKRVTDCAEKVMNYVNQGKIVYGITTGFGSLKNVAVHGDKTIELQKNLLRSHACGWGEPLTEDIVRSMMLLRLNALLQGHSGIRPETVRLLSDFLNIGLYPYIPSRGSVGASGDLSPLSHLALCLIGEGEFLKDGRRIPAADVLSEHNLKPLNLFAKEGLALINGTQLMTSIGLKISFQLDRLIRLSALASSMSLEALMGTRTAFRPEIHRLRPHQGQLFAAELIYRLTENSEIIDSHSCCNKVQDAYSLRCIPQVLGAVRDTLAHCVSVLKTEMNSVTDNPLIFGDEVLSGGNFHGEPVAVILDFLSIVMTELGSITERRIERLVNTQLNDTLPPFLIKEGGVNSGFMILQYLAAALVSECKALSHPGSVDSIPTSANQEDHVSMGPVAGFKALSILEKLITIVSLEFLTAAQGLDFIDKKSSAAITEARKIIRKRISFMSCDRPVYLDIEKIRELVLENELLDLIKGESLVE